MQALVILLIGAFVIGGTGLGRWLLAHRWVMLVLATVAAASYYSLRITWG